jgi:hypothetical protein
LGEQQRQQFNDQAPSTLRTTTASACSEVANTILSAASEYFQILDGEVHL